MTEQEVRKLGRRELLEILLEQSKEVDRLQEELASAREQLQNREIALNEAGSIAEASLRLSGIFDAAQNAANQYLENIEKLSGRQKEVCLELETECKVQTEKLLAETIERCKKMNAETREKCDLRKTEVQRFCEELDQETKARCAQLDAETKERCA